MAILQPCTLPFGLDGSVGSGASRHLQRWEVERVGGKVERGCGKWQERVVVVRVVVVTDDGWMVWRCAGSGCDNVHAQPHPEV